jgi:hypothetical protein
MWLEKPRCRSASLRFAPVGLQLLDAQASLHIGLGFHGSSPFLFDFGSSLWSSLGAFCLVTLRGSDAQARLHIRLGFHGVLLSLLGSASRVPRVSECRSMVFIPGSD